MQTTRPSLPPGQPIKFPYDPEKNSDRNTIIALIVLTIAGGTGAYLSQLDSPEVPQIRCGECICK